MAKGPEASQMWQGGAEAATGSARRRAFEALILIHLNAAYTLARYLARRADVAEDIVQDSLVRAYRGFESQRSDNARAWLLAIVRNCFLTWKARSHEHDQTAEDVEELSVTAEGYASEQETPESLLIKHEEINTMRSLIEGLPHPFREVLVLRDLEDMSYREIAEITGVPVGTVMSRLSRARKMFAMAWKGSEMTGVRGQVP